MGLCKGQQVQHSLMPLDTWILFLPNIEFSATVHFTFIDIYTNYKGTQYMYILLS